MTATMATASNPKESRKNRAVARNRSLPGYAQLRSAVISARKPVLAENLREKENRVSRGNSRDLSLPPFPFLHLFSFFSSFWHILSLSLFLVILYYFYCIINFSSFLAVSVFRYKLSVVLVDRFKNSRP